VTAFTTLEEVETVRDRVMQIKPLLAGLDPALQGAVIADLLSIWLAAHHVSGVPALAVDRLLQSHIEVVRMLLPENIKAIKRGAH
jgi:hypothetical protein